MNATARFVGLDLRSMRPNAKYMIIPVGLMFLPVLLFSGLGLVIPALTGRRPDQLIAMMSVGPYLLIPLVSSLATASAPPYLFGNDERGRLDTLYTALGIKRRQVVAGRYATLLLLLIALTLAGFLLAPVVALAFGIAFDWVIAAASAAGSVALISLLLAAQLPAYFATGPGPARSIASVAPAVVLAAVFVVALLDLRIVLRPLLGDANPAWLALAAIAVLVLLGVASTRLSMRLYARRDL